MDPAICENVEQRAVARLPAVLRVAVHPPGAVISTAQSLADIGNPPVDFAVPTHLHWDHVCGLLDLPSLPVMINAAERAWAMDGAVAPVGGVRAAVDGHPIEEFDLTGPPVSTVTASRDLFGDGSALAVDLAGHTPASVGLALHTVGG